MASNKQLKQRRRENYGPPWLSQAAIAASTSTYSSVPLILPATPRNGGAEPIPRKASRGGLSVLQADALLPVFSFVNLSRPRSRDEGALSSVSVAVMFSSLSSPHISLSFVCAFAAWAEIDKVS
ncbi:hypothetical protein Landi51_13602 [Colletotrichum acutatum]